jgi:hypothetical protein
MRPKMPAVTTAVLRIALWFDSSIPCVHEVTSWQALLPSTHALAGRHPLPKSPYEGSFASID